MFMMLFMMLMLMILMKQTNIDDIGCSYSFHGDVEMLMVGVHGDVYVDINVNDIDVDVYDVV